MGAVWANTRAERGEWMFPITETFTQGEFPRWGFRYYSGEASRKSTWNQTSGVGPGVEEKVQEKLQKLHCQIQETPKRTLLAPPGELAHGYSSRSNSPEFSTNKQTPWWSLLLSKKFRFIYYFTLSFLHQFFQDKSSMLWLIWTIKISDSRQDIFLQHLINKNNCSVQIIWFINPTSKRKSYLDIL